MRLAAVYTLIGQRPFPVRSILCNKSLAACTLRLSKQRDSCQEFALGALTYFPSAVQRSDTSKGTPEMKTYMRMILHANG